MKLADDGDGCGRGYDGGCVNYVRGLSRKILHITCLFCHLMDGMSQIVDILGCYAGNTDSTIAS